MKFKKKTESLSLLKKERTITDLKLHSILKQSADTEDYKR